MEYILGIDTGGTYTDGVVICAHDRHIVAKAKVFTTHDELSDGIRRCIAEMKFDDVKKIREVHLSSTIAVNKILEGGAESIGLLQIGRSVEGKLPCRYRYTVSLPQNCSKGFAEINECDTDEIRKTFFGNVKAVVVTAAPSKYSTDTECYIAQNLEEKLGMKCEGASCVCEHDDYYTKTVNAVFTVFLKPVVEKFINSIRTIVREYGIADNVFIVNALGKLISCDEATANPLETVFSGLAASVNGGTALTDEKDFLLIDMGGTSSEVTRITGGIFGEIKGTAKIDGYAVKEKTMNIKSYGVGGDSYIRITQCKDIQVGPYRAIPLCVAADKYPYLYDEILTYRKPANYEILTSQEINCYIGIKGAPLIGLNSMEALTVRYLTDNPHNVFYIAEHFDTDVDALHMDRLVKQNAVRLISLTPTDILHAEGRFNRWDSRISNAAVTRMADAIGADKEEFLEIVNENIINALSKVCMQGIAAFEDVEFDFDECSGAEFLLNSFFENRNRLLKTEFSIDRPIVAVGAPAGAWMGRVADKMKTKAIIPEHGEVANAYGAAIAAHSQRAGET